MQFVALTVVLVIVAAGVWSLRPTVVFVIRFRQGTPRVVRGRLAETALRSIHEICRQNGVTTGEIRGLPVGRRIRLTFSREFSPGCQQQLRNMVLSGSMDDFRLSPPR
jgi:hypothetical protein